MDHRHSDDRIHCTTNVTWTNWTYQHGTFMTNQTKSTTARRLMTKKWIQIMHTINYPISNWENWNDKPDSNTDTRWHHVSKNMASLIFWISSILCSTSASKPVSKKQLRVSSNQSISLSSSAYSSRASPENCSWRLTACEWECLSVCVCMHVTTLRYVLFLVLTKCDKCVCVCTCVCACMFASKINRHRKWVSQQRQQYTRWFPFLLPTVIVCTVYLP